MLAWPVIVLLCLLLHAWKHLERDKPPSQRRVRSDDVAFSGHSVREGRLWVFVTATFGHADWSHVGNNMVHMSGYAPELEAEVGALAFFLLFVLTGAAGWTAKLVHARLSYGEASYDAAAQFMTGIGSSPATYGLAFCAALLCAPDERCCGAGGGGSLRRIWPALLGINKLAFDAVGPGDRSRGASVSRPAHTAAALGAPLVVSLLMGGSVLAWLPAYLSFVEQHRIVNKHCLGVGRSSADDLSHLGGAACGVAVAFALRPGLAEAHSVRGLVAVALSSAYLIFRAAIHED